MFQLNANYFIQTPTVYIAGNLIEESEHFLKLHNASWIADTGRFTGAMVDSNNFSEVELYNAPVILSKAAIICATQINVLPTDQK